MDQSTPRARLGNGPTAPGTRLRAWPGVWGGGASGAECVQQQSQTAESPEPAERRSQTVRSSKHCTLSNLRLSGRGSQSTGRRANVLFAEFRKPNIHAKYASYASVRQVFTEKADASSGLVHPRSQSKHSQ